MSEALIVAAVRTRLAKRHGAVCAIRDLMSWQPLQFAPCWSACPL
jgi:hypothetical protein